MLFPLVRRSLDTMLAVRVVSNALMRIGCRHLRTRMTMVGTIVMVVRVRRTAMFRKSALSCGSACGGSIVGGIVVRLVAIRATVVIRIVVVSLVLEGLRDFFQFSFPLNRVHFAVERRSKLARGATKLCHRLAKGTAQLRELFRAKDQQREDENEDCFLNS